ncbi:translation initiation factor eIF-2B subunit alpha [Exophiala dermatitidis]|uniref:Translation initiation factor eIF2B subunit alpha n=1 Tax=Exophiala dermatitidis TaxID=5970 RepID=A0AAN6ER70_EXODE|nr:translation initiation factor eIF-2B subunit alpha [Exophiala dermatitidis]KAJ4512298.1 translation initiation factor eIF-2B subunit alpha [Exophiala dermatitidis]KAJ4512824.1 translation initiation factor eIF-2B subunit alpha [Exophiala dermatitidis]KAJ4542635.1 translation initiation factor eIF-2B subunit alpha [Exophiala dermatitidis]KAJ4546454.1 translation initiation factor eIF-2B subunit alpha [Exophiala dermatitidis]
MASASAPVTTPPMTPKAMSTSTSDGSPSTDFDIVAFYNDLISREPTISRPIAAIESLISLLASTPLTTISETLALLSTHSSKLLASQRNPIPLSAGTELFQRYLVSSFQQRPSSLANSDFTTLRQHILTTSSLFVKRANEARPKIAHHALPFLRDDSTVFTYGYSRAVQTLLTHAAEANRSFNVVYILPASGVTGPMSQSIAALNSLSIPTATISLQALTYALASMPPSSPPPQFIVGATAVLENGSIVTDLGMHQLALVAKSVHIPLHVAVESYKFVRNFPLGYGPADLARMGVKQNVLQFQTAATTKDSQTPAEDTLSSEEEMVEITPPQYIDALITENGILTPNAVSEELIKLWF